MSGRTPPPRAAATAAPAPPPSTWSSLQTHVPPDEPLPDAEAPSEGGGSDPPQERRAVLWAPSLPELRALIARAAEGEEEGEEEEEGANAAAAASAASAARREQARAALAELAGATCVQAAGIFPPGTGMVAIATHGAAAIAGTARALAEAAAAAASAAPAPQTHHHHHCLRLLRPPLPLRVSLGDDTFVFTPDDLVEASALLRPGISLSRTFGGFFNAGVPLSGLEKLTLGLLLSPGGAALAPSPHPPRGVFPASVKRLCMVPYAQLPVGVCRGAGGEGEEEEREEEEEEEEGDDDGGGGGNGDGNGAPPPPPDPPRVSLAACRHDMGTYLRAVRCCRDLRVLEVAADMDTPCGDQGAARLVAPSCRPSFFPRAAGAFSQLVELRVIARFESSPGCGRRRSPFFSLAPFPRLESALLHNLGAAAAAPSLAARPPAAFDLELGLPRAGRGMRSLGLCGFAVVGWGGRQDGQGGSAAAAGGGGAAGPPPPLPEELRLEGCALRARRGGGEFAPLAPGQAPHVVLLSAVGWAGEADGAGAAGAGTGTATKKLTLCRCCCCCCCSPGSASPRPPADEQAWGKWLLRAFLGQEEGGGEAEQQQQAGSSGNEWSGGRAAGAAGAAGAAAGTAAVAVRVCEPAQAEPALALAAWDAMAGMVEEDEVEEEEGGARAGGATTTTAAAVAGATAEAGEEEGEAAAAAGVATLTVHP